MKILFEVGDKTETIEHPDDAGLHMDQPMRGWMTVEVKGAKPAWYRLDRVIAVLP